MGFKEGQWTYNYCNTDTWLNGEYFDTKGQAIEAGKEEYKTTEDHFVIGQIEPAVIGTNVDVDRVLEDIGERVYDDVGEVAEDYLQDVTTEHVNVLEERLSKVVSEWMVEFNYEPNYFHVVNVEEIKIYRGTNP